MEAALSSFRYPCVLTEPDTTGEKLVESFLGSQDVEQPGPFDAMRVLRLPDGIEAAAVASFLTWVEDRVKNSYDLTISDVGQGLTTVVPEFQHAWQSRGLDDRL